uniref:Transposase Tc1-like domain-containing protein n=1 Tax=Astyanax mexicanus TaxID=7994 RepID=A0A8B9H1S2_ASTMX
MSRVILLEVTKNPRVTSKQLKASVILANVNESTTRRTLNKSGVHIRVARGKLSKKKIAACLNFAKDHMDKTEFY